jgi:sec-independent protein translocase protein TatC
MNDKAMTFTEHLAELRRRVTVCLAVFLLAAIGAFSFVDEAAAFLMAPAAGIRFVYLSPPDLFMAYVKIALVIGLILSLPVILMELLLFVSPALPKGGKLKAVVALFFGAFFFVAGAAFAYFVILPFTLRFFLSYASPSIEALFSITDYYDFVSSLALAFGASFELPMVAWVLGAFGLLRAATLSRVRRLAVLGIFIAAAILTPPDVVSQILLALPMLGLYELSVIILKAQERGRARRIRRAAAAEAASAGA